MLCDISRRTGSVWARGGGVCGRWRVMHRFYNSMVVSACVGLRRAVFGEQYCTRTAVVLACVDAWRKAAVEKICVRVSHMHCRASPTTTMIQGGAIPPQAARPLLPNWALAGLLAAGALATYAYTIKSVHTDVDRELDKAAAALASKNKN